MTICFRVNLKHITWLILRAVSADSDGLGKIGAAGKKSSVGIDPAVEVNTELMHRVCHP